MERKGLHILLFVLVGLCVQGQNRRINFEEAQLPTILEKAKAQNKLIFIDAYTSWCGPCKLMAAKVFTNDTVADFFNSNFVNTKFDMEKGEGVDLAKRYEVKVFPTFLLIDANGNLVHKFTGYQKPADFIARVKDGFNPLKTMRGMTEAFDKGNRNPEMVAEYVKALGKEEKENRAAEVAKLFVKEAAPADIFTKEGWTVTKVAAGDANVPEFGFVLTNKGKFSAVVGDTTVDRFINYKMHLSSLYLVKYFDKEKVAAMRGRIEQVNNTEKQLDYQFLDIAGEKNDGNVSAIVEVLGKIWSFRQTEQYQRMLLLAFTCPLVAEKGSADEIRTMLTYVDTYIGKVPNKAAQESVTLAFRNPLQKSLDQKK